MFFQKVLLAFSGETWVQNQKDEEQIGNQGDNWNSSNFHGNANHYGASIAVLRPDPKSMHTININVLLAL